MTLADGQPLCATIPLSESDGLEEGAVVTAYFNADRVIIATLC
jgi:molybdate transport system regulatory protein